MEDRAVLNTLRIENLAIVDALELNLSSGLNVLSGETGAGKSVLVEGLSLLLGGRATPERVRAGAEQAVVEAVIETDARLVAALAERGFMVGDELLVRRVVSSKGKSRVSIDGQLATVGVLEAALAGLVDVSGQHEHVTLLDPETHAELLDAHGGLGAVRRAVAEAHAEVQRLARTQAEIAARADERARREDFVRFQLDEIAAVRPKEGELAELEAARRRLAHAARLAEGAARAEAQLYSGDGAASELVGRAHTELSALARLDPGLDGLVERLGAAIAELEDVARELAAYGGALEADPEALARADERCEAIRRLAKKHGGSEANILAAEERLAAELDGYVRIEETTGELEAKLAEASATLSAHTEALSAGRRQAAEALSTAVEAELRSLSLGGARVVVALEPLAGPTAKGRERVELMVSTNPGEPPRPLRKTASGGELSRLMLAFKTVLAEKDGVRTYVFDEIDTGVGGRSADVVGQKLKEVSRSRQVVCITHLPQVAAYADRHFRVHKRVQGDRTVTEVEALSKELQIEELARMLGGVRVTQKTRELAREMRSRSGRRVA